VNRGWWALSLAACGVLVALWGASVASARTYEVSYSASGHYTAETLAPIACGNETENEDTHFSWAAQYRLSLSFSSTSFGGASETAQPMAIPGDDNSSTVMFSGCAGDASCHGDSEPAPGNKTQLKVTGASAGSRSRFLVNGLGNKGIKPEDFSGSWSAGDPGSCESWAQSANLVTEEFDLYNEVEAKFPVKYSTMKSLPVGHYFKVHISPGHYAAAKGDFCHADDGCESETFDWSGVVRVKRVS
jgi:hypothetical protein